MEPIPLLPNDVLASVERHKSPADPEGFSAFRINYQAVSKSGRNKTNNIYIPFQVDMGVGSERWMAVHLSFFNMNTVAKIKPYEDRMKGKIKAAQLTYRGNTTYEKDGVMQRYGEAKVIAYKAFVHHAGILIRDRKIRPDEEKIRCSVQFTRKDENDQVVELEVPLVRTGIKFTPPKGQQNNSKKDLATYPIYDADRRISTTDPLYIKQKVPFREASINGRPLTFGNVHEFITAGSATSGVDSFDSVCLSSMGVSLPTKVTLLIVKKSRGFVPDASKVFSGADFENMGSAVTIEVVEPEEPEEKKSSSKKGKSRSSSSSEEEDSPRRKPKKKSSGRQQRRKKESDEDINDDDIGHELNKHA